MDDSLRLHPEVASDLRDAISWYARISSGLANRFRQEVQQAFDWIAENPGVSAVAFDDVHFTRVHSFPYLIQYRLLEDTPVVLGVFHGASDPAKWRRRAH
jgi:plasmid stabilization system protein ParE